MSWLGKSLIFVLSVNIVMFLAQGGMNEISAISGLGNTSIYNCENSTLSSFGSCTTYSLNQDPRSALPGGSSAVDPTTGNIFTDGFTAVKNWFLDTTMGAAGSWIWGILSAPYSFMKAAGLPSIVSFAFGTAWYGLTFFLIVKFILDRGD